MTKAAVQVWTWLHSGHMRCEGDFQHWLLQRPVKGWRVRHTGGLLAWCCGLNVKCPHKLCISTLGPHTVALSRRLWKP